MPNNYTGSISGQDRLLDERMLSALSMTTLNGCTCSKQQGPCPNTVVPVAAPAGI